jgi:hypothetical protein
MNKVRSIFCVIDLWHVSGSFAAFQCAQKAKGQRKLVFWRIQIKPETSNRKEIHFGQSIPCIRVSGLIQPVHFCKSIQKKGTTMIKLWMHEAPRIFSAEILFVLSGTLEGNPQ